ncbi:MAG: DUF3365 domain-containing protein [Betaproteobacteria bacterium]|nr:MAG: DUF3365 domain-containing protein [Betaproteobacteria bacterium]
MNRLLTVLLSTALLAVPAAADHHVEPEQHAMTLEARQVSKDLIKQLGGALKQALKESGPEGAISVCRDTAPMLAASLSRQTGWKVSRVSLKTRNPLIGQPDAWEQKVLGEFDEAAAAARNTTNLEHAEIVDEPDGRYFRYMKALPVKPLCLTCHGSEKLIPDPVKARLRQEYPNDRATGYYAGQIRGAVTIKRRLEPSN